MFDQLQKKSKVHFFGDEKSCDENSFFIVLWKVLRRKFRDEMSEVKIPIGEKSGG